MNTLENTITTMGLLSKEAYNVGNFQIGGLTMWVLVLKI